MKLADAQRSGTRKKTTKRVGRGPASGGGKTCGRGHKGRGQRSGTPKRKFYQGGSMPLFRRIPKRGFNNRAFKESYEVVNLDGLDRFAKGDIVTPAELDDKRLVRSKHVKVKILGRGALTKALTVKAHKFSESAKAKIEAAGGTVEYI